MVVYYNTDKKRYIKQANKQKYNKKPTELLCLLKKIYIYIQASLLFLLDLNKTHLEQ